MNLLNRLPSMLFACGALAVAPALRAAPMSPAEVATAVETWVRHVTADSRAGATIALLQPYEVDGRVVAYVASLAGGGFCLCGADDTVLPVYLYSPAWNYDPDNPDYQYILNAIAARTATIRAAQAQDNADWRPYAARLAERRASWYALVAGRVPRRQRGEEGRGEPDMMTLPVTSCWHQGSPYNDQCPVLTPGSDEHCVTGCVATASAQIMYYWRWPNTGVGASYAASQAYRWRAPGDWDYESLTVDPNIPAGWGYGRLQWLATNGGQLELTGYWDNTMYEPGLELSLDPAYDAALTALWNRLTPVALFFGADFSTATYDWSIMTDVHEDPPGPDDAEVAKLCYHIGVAEEMEYGVWASSSHTMRAAEALPLFFGYDGDAVFNSRSIATMTTEITWLRPVQLGGQSEDGGHSWVVCGYNKATDPDRQFLMNMGWGGGSTQWYSCDDIFPDDQGHTTRIAPQDVIKFVGGGTRGDGSPGSPYADTAQAAANYPDGATLIFKAGTLNTFSGGPLTLDRPCTLRGYDVTIQFGG